MSHKKYRTETTCLNCGTEVSGNFCSNCGQENVETHENFFHLAGHFISDYFHFDSKFFRSLIPLFIRPGFLTKEYWHGRRVHYIHPLRLFFFITIIFMISTTAFYRNFGDQMKKEMIKPDKKLAQIDSTYITSLKDRKLAKELTEAKIKDERMKRKLSKGIDDFFVYIKYMTFFLLPVYALVFRVLYRRRRPFYVDHLVYAMHLQSFAYVLFGFVLLIPFVFPQSFNFLLTSILLVIFMYVGISLHFLYKQPWWKTFLKSVLATFSLFFITIFVMVMYAAFDAMLLQ
jgi:Protein of unknown function (DUF3667)